MKKVKAVLLAAMSMLVFPLAACSDEQPVSNKGSVNQGDSNIFPYSSRVNGNVYMGDVMPFYDNGVMSIYHLQDKVGSRYMFYHPISRLTTSDYITYKDEGIALNFEEDIASPDAALGTGSFIKGTDGKYHCFYTGHFAEKPAGGHQEVIRHAVSSDGQKTWVKDNDFNIEGTSDDFRDPYVYYDNADSCYYMLVTTRRSDKGVIDRYKSTSLDAEASGWTYEGIFFENDEGTYNMECPSYLEYNGYWYLAYSEQGNNRVTHYRYQTEKGGEWKKFALDSIDSAGFYAGRLEKAGDKLYAFAWCAKLTNGDTGDFDWGGNLVAHEIKQGENGELTAVMVSGYKDAFSTPINYYRKNGEKVSSFSFTGETFQAYGVEPLSKNITRMHFTVKLDTLKGDFGLTFGMDGTYDNRLGSRVLAFHGETGRLNCYNDVRNILRYNSELTGVNFAFAAGTEYDVDLLIDGQIVVVYLDNKVAMSMRFADIQEKGFAFYSNGTKATVGGISFYE